MVLKLVNNSIFRNSHSDLFIAMSAEKVPWPCLIGAGVLPSGHHREGLLWSAVHGSLQCQCQFHRSNSYITQTNFFLIEIYI